MKEILYTSAVNGASSAFVEYGLGIILKYFSEKRLSKNKQINEIEIKRYINEYMQQQFPHILDSEYIGRKLHDLFTDFLQYAKPNLNIQGNIVVIINDKKFEQLIENYSKSDRIQQWNEVELNTINPIPMIETTNKRHTTIDGLIQRAKNIGINLDISDHCSDEKLKELTDLIEQYEKMYKL